VQLSDRTGGVLRDVDAPQSAASPGRRKDGRSPRRRTAEDGRASAAQERQVSGDHGRLPSDSGIRQSGEQGWTTVCRCSFYHCIEI